MTITAHFGFVFKKKTLYPHENEKQAFSNFSSLKSIFEKLRFRDGLVWAVGLTVEIKLRFRCSQDDWAAAIAQFSCDVSHNTGTKKISSLFWVTFPVLWNFIHQSILINL